MSTNPISFRFPFESQIANLPPEVQHLHRTTWNAITDLQGAIAPLKAQIDTNKTSIETNTSTINSNTASETVVTAANVIGTVNNQSGVTSYTTLPSDYGSFILLNDASPIAVTLSGLPMIQLPFFVAFLNFGTGSATIIPASGLINGAANFVLPGNNGITVSYDGVNYYAEPTSAEPLNTPAIAHEWINAYNASTGAFTQTRPDYSDLTGVPQLPNTIAPVAGEYLTGYNAGTGNFSLSTPAGLSVTITTAALTVGGTQGSQTFVGGILTAQVPAT